MSPARVQYLRAAQQEADAVFDWYFERSPVAAAAFLHELDRAVSLIAESPKIWPPFHRATRRCMLRKFPYSIIYRERHDVIEVVAVAHHRRRPLYWAGR